MSASFEPLFASRVLILDNQILGLSLVLEHFFSLSPTSQLAHVELPNVVAVAESIQGFGGWTSIVVHVPADFVYLGPLGDIPMEACKPSQIYIYYIIYKT